LYGSSLILGTVGVSLRQHPDLEIVPLGSPLPALPELTALAPDVVLFDLRSASPDLAGSWLEARPHLLLIGLDADSDQTVFWAGERSRVLSIQDLVQVIQADPGHAQDRKRRAR